MTDDGSYGKGSYSRCGGRIKREKVDVALRLALLS